LKADKRVPISD